MTSTCASSLFSVRFRFCPTALVTHAVAGMLPSIFSLHAVTYVLCALADKPLPIKNRRKVYERLLHDLQQREAKQEGDSAMIRCSSLPLPPYTAHSSRHSWLPEDEDNIALLFEGIRRGRSIVPPHAVPAWPMAMRWRSKTSPS